MHIPPDRPRGPHLNLDPKAPSYFRASAYRVRAPCMRLLTYAVSLPYFCHAMAVDTSAPTIDPVESEYHIRTLSVDMGYSATTATDAKQVSYIAQAPHKNLQGLT